MARATKDLKEALAALPREALEALPAEHRQTILSQTLDADTVLDENMDKEDAAMVLLRISSLLAAQDVGIEWTPQLEALALLDDKKLGRELKLKKRRKQK